MTNGARIREIRKAKGLTQEEFAGKLGVTGAYISKLENGKATPSPALMRLIDFTNEGNRTEPEENEDAKMNPRDVMKTALRMAKNEKQLLHALNTANMGYEVCGYTEEWEQLMKHLMQRAMQQDDSTTLAMVAQAYCSKRGSEINPA